MKRLKRLGHWGGGGAIEEDRSDPGDRLRIPEGLANEESIMTLAGSQAGFRGGLWGTNGALKGPDLPPRTWDSISPPPVKEELHE